MADINFEPKATKYSAKNAYFLGKAAQLAYQPLQVVENVRTLSLVGCVRPNNLTKNRFPISDAPTQ